MAVASADSLTMAFLTLLELRQPVERAVLLLHDVFGYPFADVAASVGRTQPVVRCSARPRCRLLVNLAKRAMPGIQAHPVRVNGEVGWYVTVEDFPRCSSSRRSAAIASLESSPS